MAHHLDIKWLEDALAKHADLHKAHPDSYRPYLYCEVGRYKPFSMATIRAALRRGYKIESYCNGRVFYVYPKD